MDLANSTEHQPLNNNFYPLITQHVKTILKSGLLLDEDYEVLLKRSTFKIYPVKATQIPLGLITSALTTLGSVFVAKRYDLSFVMLPPFAFTIGLVCLRRYSEIKFRRREEIVNGIVGSLIKLRKLNASIIQYTKLRKELGSTQQREIFLYNQNFEVFVEFFLRTNRNYFKSCLINLEYLVNLTGELSEDFESFKQISIESVLSSDYSRGVDEYFNIAVKVQDIYVFLTSKFLNYIALTFCKNSANLNIAELEVLLDKKLPSINDTLNKLYGEIQKEFSNLRYGTSKKIEIDSLKKNTINRHVSGKLQQTLLSAVNNLSIVTEKLKVVFSKLETAESDVDITSLQRALGDLRDHTFATYESLDVLCRLYGIFSEATKPQEAQNTDRYNYRQGNNSPTTVETFNYDDSINVQEENYELFIPKNDKANESEEREQFNDPSGEYLGLMLKELRQSLREHERFKAARDKRGIRDDEESKSVEENKLKGNNKKFNLKLLESEATLTDKNDSISLSVPTPRLSRLPPPPPPPPPPPNFDLSAVVEDESVHNNKRSLFDNIRTLSSQLEREEDVFGSGDSESD